MTDLIRVYATYDIANQDLSAYVQKNEEAFDKVILGEEIDQLPDKIDMGLLVELRAVEMKKGVLYFLRDGVLNFGIEEDDSNIQPNASINEFVRKVKERIIYREQEWIKETACKVNMLPIFYTIEEIEHVDEKLVVKNVLNILEEISQELKLGHKEAFELEKLLKELLKDSPPLSPSRGLLQEERELFERVYHQI